MNRPLLPFLFFCGVFLALFLQFPLNDSLPGKVDTWFFLTAFNEIGLHIEQFISGTMEQGTSLYPELNVYAFGNYSFAQAFFFLPFKWLELNDVWAYYFFFVLLFALNSTSVFLLGKLVKLKDLFAVIAGLLFSCCNFVFGNMDNPDALFLSIGLFGLYFFILQLKNPSTKNTILAFLLIGLEVYFSSYGFLFVALTALLLGLIYYDKLISIPQLKRNMLGLGILLLVLLPYLSIYIFGEELKQAYNPAAELITINSVSLKFSDFIHPLRNNILYPSIELAQYDWLYKSKSAFIGIAFPILSVFGLLLYKGKKRVVLIVIFTVFLLIAMGPFMPTMNSSVRTPLYWIYEYFNIHQFFRINIRAFLLCVLVMSICSAYFLQYLHLKKKLSWLAFGLTAFILIENVPFKFEKYNSQFLIDSVALTSTFNETDVVLHLPSSFYSSYIPEFENPCTTKSKNYEFEFIREYLYMYSRTKHLGNVVNGFTGFIPQSRIRNQNLILRLMESDNLRELILTNNMTHIVIHKNFFDECPSTELIDFLNQSQLLQKENESENTVMYMVKMNSSTL